MPTFNDWFPTSLYGVSHVNVKAFGALGNNSNNTMTDLGFANVAAANAGTGGNGIAYPKATQMSDTADWCGIQAAIDYAIQNEIKNVIVPDGDYRLNDTVHAGYGMIAGTANFNSIVLSGVGWAGVSGLNPGTTFHALFKDRPIVNIQGGRQSGVQGISFAGPTAMTWPGDENLAGRANAANYVPTGAVDDPNAPFCGVCIDAYYSGTSFITESVNNPPANPYPTPRFPSFVQSTTNAYNKGQTSEFFVRNCSFWSTLIGVMQQPYIDGNGDFSRLSNNKFSDLKIGVCIGNSQARQIDFQNNIFEFCHTAVQGVGYGHGIGNLAGNWTNIIMNKVYRLIHGMSDWSSPVCIIGAYAEQGMIIGDAPSGMVTFESCRFDIGDMVSLTNWRAEPVFFGSAVFRKCIFFYRTFYHFAGGRYTFDNCSFNFSAAMASVPANMRKALDALGHVIVDLPSEVRNGPALPFQGVNSILGRNAQSGITQQLTTDGYNGWSAGHTLWGVGQKDSGYSFEYDVTPLSRFDTVTAGGAEIADGVLQLTSGTGIDKAEVGDIYYVPARAYYYVDSVAAGPVVTIKAMTWFKYESATLAMFTNAELDYIDFEPDSWPTQSTYMPIGILDMVPASVNDLGGSAGIFMKTTAGSPTIEFVNAAGTAVNRPAALTATSKPLWVGVSANYVAGSYPFPAHTTISVLNPTATTMTMSANALTTGTWAYGPGIKRLK